MKRLLPSLLSLAAACGHHAIESRFQPTAQPNEQRVEAELTVARAREERPVVVAVLEDGARLAMWDLASSASWVTKVAARSAPLVAGDTIVLQEAQGITVRDLATGALLSVVDSEGKLVGADGVGKKVVLSILHEGAEAPGTIVLVEGNKVRFREALHLPTGIPALIGPYVVAPWATQRLSILSADEGTELARYDVPNMVIGAAFVSEGRLLFGEQAVTVFAANLRTQGVRPTTMYAPLKRSLPGQPPLVRSGYEPVPAPESASHRLAVTFEAALVDQALHARSELLVERFYRTLIGFAADRPDLLFVRTFDDDLVAAHIVEGGVLTVDQRGTLRFSARDGQTRVLRELGQRVRVATLRPGKLALDAATETPQAGAERSLHDELLALIKLDDARLLPLRSWAVERLEERPEPTVTAELLALCEDDALAEALRNKACSSLAGRKDGQNEVLAALARHGSFLEDTSAPPLGALAEAAGSMKLRAAGPLLISHLEDMNTRVDDVPELCAALVAIEHRPATTSLERFVRIHHAEPAGTDVGQALYAAIDALGGLKVKSSRATLSAVADDLLSSTQVRERARNALKVLDAPPAAPTTPATKTKAAPLKEAPPEEVLPDPRPWSLSADDVATAFKRLKPALLRCLASDGASSARVSLVVSGEGKVEGIFVTPTTAQGCMDPFLRTAPFPKTQRPRQHITQTLRAENAK